MVFTIKLIRKIVAVQVVVGILEARYILPSLFFIIFSHFCSFMVVWGLGVWGWGLGLVSWGWGFQLIGFGACGVGYSGFFGIGALYINIER